MCQVRQRREAGFTLIELLIVILMVGILAAAGIPLYLGYVKDAKTAEGKAVVSSYWTAWRSAALQQCSATTGRPIAEAFARAGLTTGGATTPARWIVPTGATLRAACDTGALAQSANVITAGTAADNDTIRIQQAYDATATPPMVLTCSTDSGVTYSPC